MQRLIYIFLILFIFSHTGSAGLQTASFHLVESMMKDLGPIETEISYREGDLIELPLGRNDNIQTEHIFVVYSQETGRFIGRICITEVRPRDSEGRIIEERTIIQPGDVVVEDEEITGNIAVIGFLNQQGRETILSRSFQSLMENDLQSLSEFAVIERRQIERHLDEARLTYQGFVAKGAEAGKMLGTDYIIIGEYTELFDLIIFNARVNETETGQILASGSVTLHKTGSIIAMLEEVHDTTLEDLSLTITAEGLGSVTPFIGSQMYAEDTVVDLQAIPNSGWEFQRWVGEVEDSRSSLTTVTMNQEKNIKAIFVQDEYTISGTVKDHTGRGIPDVLIEFSGEYSPVTTSSAGTFSKSGLRGTVHVTPIKEGYLFTPSRREIQGEENQVNFTGSIVTQIGDKTRHQVGDTDFFMRLAPATTFPTGTDDKGRATIHEDFWIAETPVTYELWYEVRIWAEKNGYIFDNLGREGNNGDIGRAPTERKNEPVSMVNWYDSFVWCNALSEYLGFHPVYTYQGRVIKNAIEIDCTNIVIEKANGFRLPTSMEWELAARYKGSDSSHGAILVDGLYWTPGNYASGAVGNIKNSSANQEVAWYSENSRDKMQSVGLKQANVLGLYDMSGNVYEWCFDWHPSYIGSHRIILGGSFSTSSPDYLQVGYVFWRSPISGGNVGLRPVRTAL